MGIPKVLILTSHILYTPYCYTKSVQFRYYVGEKRQERILKRKACIFIHAHMDNTSFWIGFKPSLNQNYPAADYINVVSHTQVGFLTDPVYPGLFYNHLCD